jgi:divalent metal cation (Fe/Co/Zn/Cd) transporter
LTPRPSPPSATPTDGFASLGVVAGTILVALDAQVADPIIGLAITPIILRITCES